MAEVNTRILILGTTKIFVKSKQLRFGKNKTKQNLENKK